MKQVNAEHLRMNEDMGGKSGFIFFGCGTTSKWGGLVISLHFKTVNVASEQ